MNNDDAITFKFEYLISGTDYEGKLFSAEGTCQPTYPLEDFWSEEISDRELFDKAAESAIDHCYDFEVEKAGLNGISEVTLTIKNLAIQMDDGSWIMNGRPVENR